MKRREAIIYYRKEKQAILLMERRGITTDYDPSKIIKRLETIKEDIALNLSTVPDECCLKIFREIQKGLEINQELTLDCVINSGIVPICVQYLNHTDKPDLTLIPAEILVHLSSCELHHTKMVVESGALPVFIRCLSSISDNIRELSLMALGNIVLTSSDFANFVIQNGIFQPLFELISFKCPTQIPVLKRALWVLSCIVRKSKATLVSENKQLFFPVLCQYLFYDEPIIVSQSAWALSYLIKSEPELIQKIANSSIMLRLKQLLNHQRDDIIMPSLRVIGNVAASDDIATESILNNDILLCFHHLLEHRNFKIQTEVAWVLSNITAGTTEQIQYVLNIGLMAPVRQILTVGNYKARVEAMWIVANIVYNKYETQIKFLIEMGVILPLCHMLYASDPEIISNILNILKIVVKVADATEMEEKIHTMIEESSGFEIIEKLQYHENLTIS
ncbi:importin subunit alpha-3-like [Centruroides vittatus]|uniref:importin subunit alpha-3-like n=1 Tax=Centruroides vittatus TaxID=120091 RepID=UPI00350E9422